MFTPHVGETYSISYDKTARIVRVMEYEQGKSYFKAFCFMRMEPRSFTIDKVMNPIKVNDEVGAAMWDSALVLPEKPKWMPTNVAYVPAVWR